jgi:hypothetical protein
VSYEIKDDLVGDKVIDRLVQICEQSSQDKQIQLIMSGNALSTIVEQHK